MNFRKFRLSNVARTVYHVYAGIINLSDSETTAAWPLICFNLSESMTLPKVFIELFVDIRVLPCQFIVAIFCHQKIFSDTPWTSMLLSGIHSLTNSASLRGDFDLWDLICLQTMKPKITLVSSFVTAFSLDRVMPLVQNFQSTLQYSLQMRLVAALVYSRKIVGCN